MRFLKRLAALVAAGGFAAALTTVGHTEDDKTIRLGFQKYGTLILLKARGLLEEKLEPQGLHDRVDRVPGRPAAPRGAECRRDRLRHHRRGAADLRPGRRCAAGLCRARAAGAAGRGDPRSRRQPAQDDRRPQGQERRAQQGLERPLPPGQGARKRRARVRRHHRLVPAAGRRPRRVREGRGRRLGDLGALPRRGRGRDRRPPARRRHRPRQQSRVLSGLALAGRPRPGGGRRHPRVARRDRRLGQCQQGQGRRGVLAAARHPGADPRRGRRPPDLWRQADHAGGRRQAAGDRRRLLRARPDPQGDQDRRRRRRRRSHERRGRRPRAASTCSGSCRPTATAGTSAPSIGGRATDLGYLRQIATAADQLGYYGVLLPTGKSCEDSLARRRGDGAARPSGSASSSRSVPACSRRRSPRA